MDLHSNIYVATEKANAAASTDSNPSLRYSPPPKRGSPSLIGWGNNCAATAKPIAGNLPPGSIPA
jgi:hypothetical protein